MPRLNPNQINSRIRGVLGTIGDVPDDQLVEILDKAGFLDRLKGCGALGGGTAETAAPTQAAAGTEALERLVRDSGIDVSEMAPEDILKTLIQSQFNRALGGDAQAGRLVKDIVQETPPENRFNVVVNVVPAKVADTMLDNCMLHAVPFHVDAGLGGLEQRMILDEAPPSLKSLGKQFRNEFMAWCETAYAPKDA